MKTETLVSSGHPVWIGPDALDHVARLISQRPTASLTLLLVDSNTRQHCLPYFLKRMEPLGEFVILEIPAGETGKSWDALHTLIREIAHAKADRNSLLVALGGGVVGDMGAFVASVFMRGMDFMLVPTTFLAAVDASVGGKCGINFDSHKNMVGVFATPRAVAIDGRFQYTLPDREWTSGWAEVIKHTLLSPSLTFPAHFNRSSITSEQLDTIIFDSVQFKDSVLRLDPYDHAERRQLNFGHTVGHAFESAAMDTDSPLLHGEAVALGMEIELILSHQLMGLSAVTLQQALHLIRACFPSLHFAVDQLNWKQHLPFDKKNRHGTWLMSLLKDKGVPVWNVPVVENVLDDAILYWRSLQR